MTNTVICEYIGDGLMQSDREQRERIAAENRRASATPCVSEHPTTTSGQACVGTLEDMKLAGALPSEMEE